VKRIAALVVLALGLSVSLPGQAPDPALLTIDRIFASDEFRVRSFGPARWMDDGHRYTTLEPTDSGKEGRDIVAYNSETGAREVLVAAEALVPAGADRPLEIAAYEWAASSRLVKIFTNTRRVWRLHTRGDYWILDRQTGELWRLGGTAPEASLMFAKFAPDGTRISYVQGNDVFVQDVTSRDIVRLTDDGTDTLINGTFDWAYEEEFGLRDGTRWSPDSQSIAYWQIDASGVGVFHLINNTDELYPQLVPIRYPKVGGRIASARVGVVAADGGPTIWMQVSGDPREHYIARMDWAGASNEVVFQRLNRLQNTNHVMLGDARTGQTRIAFTDRDDAWLDVVNNVQWLNEGQRFTWVSEQDGWRRVYLIPRDGGAPTGISGATHDVIDVARIDRAGRWLYYRASPDDATQAYLYRASLDGTADVSRITPNEPAGTHTYDVSPDGRWAFRTWSAFGEPPLTDLVSLPDHRSLRILEDNRALRSKLQALRRGRTEFLTIQIGGGVALDAWRMLPPEQAPEARYPLLVHVYGEPAGQTVVDRWGGTNYLWHLMLSQRGYVVASADNRGTPAPKGRAWRKIIYRQIGILASDEQAAAVRRMQTWAMVDPKRIGVWGWSGGGSMTLNALFRHPNLYQVGVSVAPVSDQQLYDAIYQERYMGLPADNPEGYRDGSPISHVSGLQGHLLLIHGTGDDNVHYQSTERLVNALISDKKRFTTMAYPNRSHSISEGENTSWHLRDLMTRFLEVHLSPSVSTGGER
jgi:dipeptidyl-peptidase 4